MRAMLLLVLRTGTAIVVATAAVQFWGLAVRGEMPALSPAIALPPTATAVAAVVPRRVPKHPAKAREAPAGGEVTPVGSPIAPAAPAPPARPTTKPKSKPASPSPNPLSTPTTKPSKRRSLQPHPQLPGPPTSPKVAPTATDATTASPGARPSEHR